MILTSLTKSLKKKNQYLKNIIDEIYSTTANTLFMNITLVKKIDSLSLTSKFQFYSHSIVVSINLIT